MVGKFFFIALILLLGAGGSALAGANNLPDPGILPDSPLYVLKTWGENIRTFFIFGVEAKANRLIYLAEKRLAEAQALIEEGKAGAEEQERAVLRYKDQLDRAVAYVQEAKEKGIDIEDILTLVSEKTLAHQEVLLGVYQEAPDKAKEALQEAVQRGLWGHIQALNAISQERRAEVIEQFFDIRQNVEQKLRNLKDEGFYTPRLQTLPEEDMGGEDIGGEEENGAPQGPAE